MKTSHKIIIGYSGWMKEVLMNHFNLFSLPHFIGNSRIMETGQDWVDKAKGIVRNRPLDAYQTGIQTIYGQLENLLGVPVEPAPDEWDRGYNVDFFIKVKDKYIGLQIKPAGYAYITQIINELEFQKKTHEKFTEKFGGKVFYIISVKEGKRKIIYNSDVIEEIRNEIDRLKKE